jgi:hypothetical protein
VGWYFDCLIYVEFSYTLCKWLIGKKPKVSFVADFKARFIVLKGYLFIYLFIYLLQFG